MKNFSTRLLILVISLNLILSCKKDGLTKATQKGANTFSCKINGKVFQPCEDPSLFGGSTLYGGVSVTTVAVARVTAECNQGYPQKHISIYLDNFHGAGEYLLSDNNNRGIYTEYNVTNPLIKTYESLLYTTSGKIIITKDDRTTFILSGTFEFTAANADSTNDIVTVTDGRFDISYKR